MRVIGYDRLIDSAVPLPGATSPGVDEQAAPDLRIKLELEASDAHQPLYRLDGSTVIFAPPAVATYRCRRDEIAVTPAIGADPESITALLLATALPAALWMSADFVLHAAAIRLPGRTRALAFCGPSGSGKSALAAALVAKGAALIADDTIRMTVESNLAIASGLPGGWFVAGAQGGARHFHAASADRQLRRCPLGAILILSEGAAADAPQRLDPVSAVEQILANRHRPRIPALLGRHADALRFSSFLARAVPVYVWRQDRETATLDNRAVAMLGRCLERGEYR